MVPKKPQWPKQTIKQPEQTKLSQREKKKLNNQQAGKKLIFLAGNIKYLVVSWRNITSDLIILDIVSQRLKINFKNHIRSKEEFEYKY